MRITYGAKTDTGRKRQHNEDNYLANVGKGLFVVADGMGGHASGEVASALAVRKVHEHLTERLDAAAAAEEQESAIVSWVQESIASANKQIHEEARRDPTKEGMGTTVCMAYLQDSKAYIGHVGDSRVYLLRAGHTHQLTDDHSFLGEMQRHGDSRNISDINPRLRNAVTRAVGTQATVRSDSLEVDLLPDDCLILCSDGLHGYTDPETLHRLVQETEGDEAEVCARLIDFANAQGGQDNITVVVIRIHATDQWSGRDVEQRLQALRSVGLFRHLSYSELLKVNHVAHERAVTAGETIFGMGDVDDTVYAILEGTVRVRQENMTLSILSKGHHFGELALVDDTPRAVTAEATMDTHLLALSRDDFYTLLRGDPQVAIKLLWSFVKSLTIRVHSITNRMMVGESMYRDVSSGDWKDPAPDEWSNPAPSPEPPPLPDHTKKRPK